MAITPADVLTVTTCVSVVAAGIANRHASVTVAPGACGAGVAPDRLTYTNRLFQNETGFRMKMERRHLHKTP